MASFAFGCRCHSDDRMSSDFALLLLEEIHSTGMCTHYFTTLTELAGAALCYRGCAEAKPACTAICQACGRVLQQGKNFHISKALVSCGMGGCTGCVKARAVMMDFPSEETIESWQNAKQLAPAAVARAVQAAARKPAAQAASADAGGAVAEQEQPAPDP